MDIYEDIKGDRGFTYVKAWKEDVNYELNAITEIAGVTYVENRPKLSYQA